MLRAVARPVVRHWLGEEFDVSLFDADVESEFRRGRPAGAQRFNADDYHYIDLVAGDGEYPAMPCSAPSP